MLGVWLHFGGVLPPLGEGRAPRIQRAVPHPSPSQRGRKLSSNTIRFAGRGRVHVDAEVGPYQCWVSQQKSIPIRCEPQNPISNIPGTNEHWSDRIAENSDADKMDDTRGGNTEKQVIVRTPAEQARAFSSSGTLTSNDSPWTLSTGGVAVERHLPPARRKVLLGCLRCTKSCWVGKHINITMKPTTPQPKANPTQEKIGEKWQLGHFFAQQIFFRGLGLVLYRK